MLSPIVYLTLTAAGTLTGRHRSDSADRFRKRGKALHQLLCLQVFPAYGPLLQLPATHSTKDKGKGKGTGKPAKRPRYANSDEEFPIGFPDEVSIIRIIQ